MLSSIAVPGGLLFSIMPMAANCAVIRVAAIISANRRPGRPIIHFRTLAPAGHSRIPAADYPSRSLPVHCCFWLIDCAHFRTSQQNAPDARWHGRGRNRGGCGVVRLRRGCVFVLVLGFHLRASTPCLCSLGIVSQVYRDLSTFIFIYFHLFSCPFRSMFIGFLCATCFPASNYICQVGAF